MVNTSNIINKLNIFWQYPARSEEIFYIQNKGDYNYIGMPWATIHDKRVDLKQIYNELRPLLDVNKYYYTSCQHIAFNKFILLWKALRINKVYVSHKRKGINNINGIELIPMPLYAVNVEDENFNKEFKDIDKLIIERPYIYSFIGAYQQADYMSDIRPKIFNMIHPDNTIIRNTGVWHLDKLVFNNMQNKNGQLNTSEAHNIKTKYYNEVLIKSRYSLCPSGSGPNSIRFWESLAIGSIPILLSDTLELPKHELWKDAIIELEENKINDINKIIEEITNEREKIMRKNCIKIYEDLKNNFKNKNNDNKVDFKVNIPINLIDSYFKVFGHFFGDHFFQLFKIKKWYEKEYNKEVENIIIDNYYILLNKASFIDSFYKCLFKNINIESNNEIVNLNIVLGSVINTEVNKLYYLGHTNTLSNIPLNILDNVRKPTEFNKVMGRELQDIILNKLNINIEEKLDNEILIINRKNSRKLLELDNLCNHLRNNNYKYKIVCFEDYNLSEQIKLVRSYNNVIVARGSVQVHISFMKENSKWIELCESGFRYPNTSVYGNRYNINTYTLCSSLTKDLNNLRNKNNNTQKLFYIGDRYPNIITNSLSDIEREVIWYTELLTPLCIYCYGGLNIQDILCNCYIDNIISILNNDI